MDWTPIGHWTLPCKILDPRLQGSTSRGSICDTILLPTINTRRVTGSTCCAVNSTKIRNPTETLLRPKFRINSSTWLHFNGPESTISLRRGCRDKLTRSRAYDSAVAVSASRERQLNNRKHLRCLASHRQHAGRAVGGTDVHVYQLRSRRHDCTLTANDDTRNFIYRLLHCDIY